MIRYTYTEYGEYPAPFVHVSLRCSQTERQIDQVPGQIDSASDRTVLPNTIVTALGLVQAGNMRVKGFGGNIQEVPTHFVEMAIRSLRPLTVKVLGAEDEPCVLVGRDVINQFRLLLDGPASALEIE
jgi:hypothetical protein